jgi:hypothetical protein
MDLDDAGSMAGFPIRDRDAKHIAALDAPMTDAGTTVVVTGVRMPRMNSLLERWTRTCRGKLLDRALVWNHGRLLHALRAFETHDNEHRPHRTSDKPRPLPKLIDEPARIRRLEVRRRDRLGETLHAYQHAA